MIIMSGSINNGELIMKKFKGYDEYSDYTFKIYDVLKTLHKKGELKFDTKGHFNHYDLDRLTKSVISGIMAGIYLHDDFDLDKTNTFQLLYTGNPHETKCQGCNSTLKLETDLKTIRPVGEECSRYYEQDFPVQIAVPSGKIAFANDMRHLFNNFRDDFYVNESIGIKQCSDAYSKIGMIHQYVGNSCPGIYKLTKDNSLVVGSDGWGADDGVVWNSETEKEETLTEEQREARTIKGNRKGSICTDLWWFSACDYDLYKRLGGKDSDVDIVDVEAGIYEATSMYKTVEDDGIDDSPIIYATIKKVQDMNFFTKIFWNIKQRLWSLVPFYVWNRANIFDINPIYRKKSKYHHDKEKSKLTFLENIRWKGYHYFDPSRRKDKKLYKLLDKL